MRKPTATIKRRLVNWGSRLTQVILAFLLLEVPQIRLLLAKTSPEIDKSVECDILIVGGGFAGVAAAYEALLSSQTVCMTEITDWLGGQVSSQGTSALDESAYQRRVNVFPSGYKKFKDNISRFYGRLNPGDCWVSESCFLPNHGHELLLRQLKDAERQRGGKLLWFPSTVAKDVSLTKSGKLIQEVTAIQHSARDGRSPLIDKPLSYLLEDAYRYEDSPQLKKTIIQFRPKKENYRRKPYWIVIDATETGEMVALTDVPYRLGLDPRSTLNPSSPVSKNDTYCTQGFTYTFAVENTINPQSHSKPSFYEQYAPYYGYDPNRTLAYFDLVFTYRRLWSPRRGRLIRVGRFKVNEPTPGDISMQNWTWGNDYRPGTAKDNLIYSRQQLQRLGQLDEGKWQGGLRIETLKKAEEHALGFFYWLVAGTTDSRLGSGTKKPYPDHRLMKGVDSPMGTLHGLAKYPYIREARRIIGRPSVGYPQGFTINEVDISANFPASYTQATQYPDSVGVSHYNVDIHPCMSLSPPERKGNTERRGARGGEGETYPAQIPLRAMIPQKIDNFLIAGKSIATSHIAAASYRVQPFEWSVGAAAGSVSVFTMSNGIFPYELVDNLPQRERELQKLQRRLELRGNPISFGYRRIGTN
ncbi:MAG: FAD-dependent oxidoreductase [Microcystaceae cyanobacterium]